MANRSEIQERINHYENKLIEYSKGFKFQHRLPVTESLLSFWKRQLVKQQKTENRVGNA